MKNKMKLIHRFSIIALVAVVIFGYAFGLLLGRSMEQQMTHGSLNEAADIVVQNVIKHFKSGELAVPKVGRDYEIFSHDIGHLSLGPNVERVKIWNRDMRVLWHRDSNMVNKGPEDSGEVKKLEKAFRGERVIQAGVREDRPDDHYYGIGARRVFELYVPIQYKKGEDIVAVFEAYINGDPFYAGIQRHQKLIWLWTCSGFSILYLLLFGIVWKASRRIDVQTRELSATVESLEREISDRKHLQYNLEKAAKEWRMTFDSTKDIIMMLDHEFRVLRTNAASIIFFNRPYHSISGAEAGKMLAQTGLSLESSFFLQTTQVKQHREEEVYSADKGVWMVASLDPIVDHEDTLTGYVFVMRDISDIKRLQETLIAAKNEWEETFESITDMITIHDENYNIIRANGEARRVLQLDGSDMNGTNKCFRYYHGTDQPPKDCPSCNCMVTRKFSCNETFEPHLNKYLEIRTIPRLNKENELIGLIHIVRDISDIRKTQEEKEKLQNQFLQVQKMDSIGRLAGGVAHDFNNIISVINGFSELSLKELPDDSPIKENLIAIHSSGEKAAALTRQLLAFSRKQVLQMNIVDVVSTMRNSVKMLGRLIGEDVVLTLHADRSVRKVIADPNQLEQILLNLTVNARDAMPDGGNITIDAVDEDISEGTENTEQIMAGQYVRISVQDTGDGMSEEVQKRIFEPFFSTKAVGKGTGLGLATVYGIVRQHSGYITVNSAPGKGTTFHVYLPASDSEGELKGPDVAEKILKGNETILVVDDEPLLIKLIVNMLKPLGYNVLQAQGGEEALLVSKRYDGRIDLLLTDVIMPGMNGKELVDRLLMKRPSLKIIFMSGYTDDTIAHHGVLEEGIVLINKPVTESHLAEKIREVIDRSEDQDAHTKQGNRLIQLNILLADDNADMRALIKAFLKEYAHTLDTAENGREAVQKFRENTYDLVLMDMQMPVMDGLEAIGEIRKSEKDGRYTPIIALTGNGAPEDITRSLKAGATAHLVKPIGKDQLIKEILSVEKDGPSNITEGHAEEPRKVLAHVDPDLMDLIPEYLEERRNDIREIQSAMMAEDFEAVRIRGHTLKGSGGGYGFGPISEMGSHIEEAAKQKNQESIGEWTDRLADYIENVEVVYE